MRRLALAGLLLGACARGPAPKIAETHTRAATMPAVTLDAGGFVRNGKRFVPVGAHWVPAKTAMGWPLQFDRKDIEADFAKMRDLGFTVTRLDLLWAWFEPRPGVYNEKAFEQLDMLVELASTYGIYLHPSLFIGGEVGEAYWDVPWRNGRHPHKDPEMIRLEANLAAELGRRYADETAIIAWDLTDEPPFWIATDVNDAQAMAWTRAIAEGIRRHDKRHPIVVGTSGQETSHGPFRADNLVKTEHVGFLSVHPFTIYEPRLFPDAMLSERSTYGAAFEIALANGAGRPAMVHEMGASTAQYSPERIAKYERSSLYSALAAGSIGIDLWCFTDAAPGQWAQLPYLRTPQEAEWGLVTWDRKDKPRGREFQKLARIVSRLEPGAAPAADVAIPIPEEWAKPHGDFSRQRLTGKEPIPYSSTEDTVGSPEKAASGNEWLMGSLLTSFILARRAGLKADFPREYDDWAKRPIVLLPSPLTATSTPFLTHVHTDFYAKARRYVEGGGILYASVAADAAVPDMTSLFGARLADTNTATDVQIRVVESFGPLAPGETYTFKVPIASARYWGAQLEIEPGSKARVVAVDQDGRPALVVNQLGRGTTVLSAYPLESWLAVTPSAFDTKEVHAKPQLVDRLHRAIRSLGPRLPFDVDAPEVEATPLDASHLVLVHHGAGPKRVEVGTTRPITTLHRLTPTGKDPIPTSNGRFVVDLPEWDGAIIEYH